nr:hypothetical protein [Tanacetum cinerariifolium]
MEMQFGAVGSSRRRQKSVFASVPAIGGRQPIEIITIEDDESVQRRSSSRPSKSRESSSGAARRQYRAAARLSSVHAVGGSRTSSSNTNNSMHPIQMAATPRSKPLPTIHILSGIRSSSSTIGNTSGLSNVSAYVQRELDRRTHDRFTKIGLLTARRRWPPRVTLGRLLPHARGLGFKPRRRGFPSGAKKEWGLSPKANVRVLHTAKLDVTGSLCMQPNIDPRINASTVGEASFSNHQTFSQRTIGSGYVPCKINCIIAAKNPRNGSESDKVKNKKVVIQTRATLRRLLPHARGLGFKPCHGGFPSGAKKEWGLSPKAMTEKYGDKLSENEEEPETSVNRTSKRTKN